MKEVLSSLALCVLAVGKCTQADRADQAAGSAAQPILALLDFRESSNFELIL